MAYYTATAPVVAPTYGGHPAPFYGYGTGAAVPSGLHPNATSEVHPTYLQRTVQTTAGPKPCYTYARDDFPPQFRYRPAPKPGQIVSRTTFKDYEAPPSVQDVEREARRGGRRFRLAWYPGYERGFPAYYPHYPPAYGASEA